MLPSDRHQRILERVAENSSVRVADLVGELGESRMTINRDLDRLDEQGAVTEVFGGAIARSEEARIPAGSCEMCGAEIGHRTAMTLFDEAGGHVAACCPHCGLLLVSQREDVASALAQGFIGGQMVSLRSAAFLFNPNVTLCCSPTELCFENESDAGRCKAGFGGAVEGWMSPQVTATEHMMLNHSREEAR